MAASTLTRPRLQIPLRLLTALLGGYAFTWGFIACAVAALYTAGMAFHDGERLSYMLAFLLYPGLFLWAFATPRLGRAALVLFVGGGLMAGLGSLLQQRLV